MKTLNKLTLFLGDALDCYSQWKRPIVIVSDGAYGLSGFKGDPKNHLALPEWYEPHIKIWSKRATPQTTLWFWNSEIGWASVHPVLEKHGWDYVNANVWNKGKAHMAGNVNSKTIRRFPVVTELCVQYVRRVEFKGFNSASEWFYQEWKRSGLPFHEANVACGVKNAASRKYLTRDHLWYWPPPEMLVKLIVYANRYGDKKGDRILL